MGDLGDELEQASDVVRHIQEHPAVVNQTVDAHADAFDYTDLTVTMKLQKASKGDDDE